MATRKEIVYDIINLLSRFNYTDDNRNDPDWIGFKVDQVQEYLKQIEFAKTGVVNPAWVSQLGMVAFTPTNFADDPSIELCKCPISKAIIPQTINLPNPNFPDQNYGIKTILDACAETQYYPYQFELWKQIPSGHVRSKCNYYSTVGPDTIYVNKNVKFLRINAVLSNPLEGYIIQTTFVTSLNLVVGTSYTVISGQVNHDSTYYQAGDTFTAVNTVFSGSGKVMPTVNKRKVTEDDPYPVTVAMARDIVLEILSKEFGIEKQRVTDVKNDSADDQQKMEQV